MKCQGIGFILCVLIILSACTVHPRHGKRVKRNNVPIKAVIKVVPEHRKQHVMPKSKSVEFVSIIKIGQNH